VKTGLAHKRRDTQFQFPSAKRAKWVINPEKSRFMSKWDLVTMVALFFVAVGTPYEVCFLDTKFDILFGINFIVNIIFLIDMGLQFVLMYPTKSPYGRRMVSEPRLIVKNYLTSWFIIDFVSILPFDLLGLLYSDVAAFQALKSVKAVRLLRLLKLMRVLRASRVFKRWETRISINYSQLSLAKFLLIMVASGHWMACLWGLMGKATFDGKDGEHVEVWLERQKKSWLYDVFPPIEGEEHIPRTPDAGEIYVASLYWSVMTLTSIGYGDIVPVTRSERLLCVVTESARAHSYLLS
jgi:potassium voltage-gated channel Eag-related subfamily H protein 7